MAFQATAAGSKTSSGSPRGTDFRVAFRRVSMILEALTFSVVVIVTCTLSLIETGYPFELGVAHMLHSIVFSRCLPRTWEPNIHCRPPPWLAVQLSTFDCFKIIVASLMFVLGVPRRNLPSWIGLPRLAGARQLTNLCLWPSAQVNSLV